MTSGPFPLDSFATGLSVLKLFLEHDVLSVSKVALLQGISRSHAHRVLTTLVRQDIIFLAPNGRGYSAGPMLIELARPFGMDPAAHAMVRPYLDAAHHLSGETVHATSLLGAHALVFDARLGSKTNSASPRAGLLRQAYATSTGKLLLSRLSRPHVLALYPDENLRKVTPRTIGSRAELLDALEVIATQDYAFNHGELDESTRGIAVLLTGHSWRDRVAISVTLPKSRGSLPAMTKMLRMLRDIAGTVPPP